MRARQIFIMSISFLSEFPTVSLAAPLPMSCPPSSAFHRYTERGPWILDPAYQVGGLDWRWHNNKENPLIDYSNEAMSINPISQVYVQFYVGMFGGPSRISCTYYWLSAELYTNSPPWPEEIMFTPQQAKNILKNNGNFKFDYSDNLTLTDLYVCEADGNTVVNRCKFDPSSLP